MNKYHVFSKGLIFIDSGSNRNSFKEVHTHSMDQNTEDTIHYLHSFVKSQIYYKQTIQLRCSLCQISSKSKSRRILEKIVCTGALLGASPLPSTHTINLPQLHSQVQKIAHSHSHLKANLVCLWHSLFSCCCGLKEVGGRLHSCCFLIETICYCLP